MNAKHDAVIEKICRLSAKDDAFAQALRARLQSARGEADWLSLDAPRMEHIYEYCIERVVRQQAQAFYAQFPLQHIVPSLVEDYVRMESFRRKDAFGDFTLAVYQQVECITNHLCRLPELAQVVERMLGCAAYVTQEKGTSPPPRQLIRQRQNGDYLVACLLFPGYRHDKKKRREYVLEKTKLPLEEYKAVDKMRTIVYFLGYGTMMNSSHFNAYVSQTNLLRDLYQCRNMNHRGDQVHDWQQKILDRVLPEKSIYYFRFLGALAQYADNARRGLELMPILLEYAMSLPRLAVKP